MFNCMKCYPKLYSCPKSKDDKIASLKMCLKSGLWSEKEKDGFRKELDELEDV